MVRALVVVVCMAALLTGCSGKGQPQAVPTVTVTQTVTPSPTPDQAKCRAAIRSDYEAGFDSQGDQWPPSTRKPVCAGIDRPTIQRLMDEAIADIMNGTPGPG